MLTDVTPAGELWRDPTAPVADRVAALLAAMTLEEKVAQLYGVWAGVDPDGDEVAPNQHEFADASLDFATLTRHGLGQLTRPFGTAPVDPTDGAKALARLQTELAAGNRFGIPALVHEECLTGFMTFQATVYPTALAWGATFNPELVAAMAAQIGESMRAVGVHQGLAPVLDVVRDPRWGRTEETIGEDPYLVATIGTAYVKGLQSTGVLATLKHFVGYSASAAGRNFGPVVTGPRQLADILLPPFELAVREGAGSIMHSYAEIDGVPTASDESLLTELVRNVWGFNGTVVADYFGISFLEFLHGVAGSVGEAAALGLTAGIDVELPTVRAYGEPLLAAVRSGAVSEELVDRAATRVLRQKIELGLLDPDWTAEPEALRAPDHGPGVDLDPPQGRALARQLAEQSVVLLTNDAGALPLAGTGRIAVVGPAADDPMAMLGCYTFPAHVGRAHSTSEEDPLMLGVELHTVLASLTDEFPGAEISHAAGCATDDPDTAGFAAAVELARQADVCVAVLGDQAGLFGRGTSGEGCDAADLRLPGVQEDLLTALLDTGKPVVLVLMTGRPYALGAVADRVAAAVQAFFPGEEGGPAVAGVLSGRVNPSGRLPVSVPATPGGQPTTYLAPTLAHRTDVSSVDPSPLYPFGHGRSYTTFGWDDPRLDGDAVPAEPAAVPTDGEVTVSIRVRNTGDRAGTDVVQLYLHDPVAQVTRPVVRLIGYARVSLEPGEARRVALRVPADLSSFTGRDGRRVVEPGALELRLGRSSTDIVATVPIELTGELRVVDHERRMTCEVELS